MYPRPPRSPLFPYTTLFRSLPLVDLRYPHETVNGFAAVSLGCRGDVSRVSSVEPDVTAAPQAYLREEKRRHTSELQSHVNLVCRLLLEKKKETNYKR